MPHLIRRSKAYQQWTKTRTLKGRILIEISKIWVRISNIRYLFKCSLTFDKNLRNFDKKKYSILKLIGGGYFAAYSAIIPNKGIVFFFRGHGRWSFIHSNPKIVCFFFPRSGKKREKNTSLFFFSQEKFIGHSFGISMISYLF